MGQKVEVLDWNGDRCPRGQYLEDLKMHSRDSDVSILEAVQILARLVSFTFFKSKRSKCRTCPEQRRKKDDQQPINPSVNLRTPDAKDVSQFLRLAAG